MNHPAAVSGGEPTLAFVLGTGASTARTATYDAVKTAAAAGGADPVGLVFDYRVLATDTDTDGISWNAGTVTLGAGVDIVRADATAATVVRDYAAKSAQADHKVDGTRSARMLTLSKTQVTEGADPQVTLTFDTAGATFSTAQTLTLTAQGTAESGEDFVLAATTMTLPAGQTEATATLTVLDDRRLEADRDGDVHGARARRRGARARP